MRFLRIVILLAATTCQARKFLTRKSAAAEDEKPYATYFFNTLLDNFDVSSGVRFPLRYLVNNETYEAGGPLFFYTGNEGDVEGFAQATGMMWDLAAQFKAAIVFAEHRYYGESMPYGTYENSYSSTINLAYANSKQALADYAALLDYLKDSTTNAPFHYPQNIKTIAFGGSYGGMLSAWMRQEYPNHIHGAWASSAPLRYFNDDSSTGVDWAAFDKVTTRTFADAGCDNKIVASTWDSVQTLAKTASGQTYLNKVFKVDNKSLITSPSDASALNAYIREAIEYLAMVDYPYGSAFITEQALPSWPVKVACKNIPIGNNFTTDEEITESMAAVIETYYNGEGWTNYTACFKAGCGDQGTSALGTPLGWPWQECTEIVMAMCSRGSPNDFFWDECKQNNGPFNMMRTMCAQKDMFGDLGYKTSMTDINAIRREYGLNFDHLTNVILTQGYLDPWSAGGYYGHDPSKMRYTTTIQNSAHHLDLRRPNTCDPSNIANIRFQIVDVLKCWAFDECPSDLDVIDKPATFPSTEKCEDIIEGYPWGQSKLASGFSLISTLLLALVLIFKH